MIEVLGRVVDPASNAVAGARVAIKYWRDTWQYATATTDEGGAFRAVLTWPIGSELPATLWSQVRATRGDDLAGGDELRMPGPKNGESREHGPITVAVRPLARIQVTVRDEGGAPVAGASCWYAPPNAWAFPVREERDEAAITDHEGRAVIKIPRLAREVYWQIPTVGGRVIAWAEGYAESASEPTVATQSGVREPDARADVTLRPTVPFRGTALLHGGLPHRDAPLTLQVTEITSAEGETEQHARPSRNITVHTDATGNFTLERLAPATYVLEARGDWSSDPVKCAAAFPCTLNLLARRDIKCLFVEEGTDRWLTATRTQFRSAGTPHWNFAVGMEGRPVEIQGARVGTTQELAVWFDKQADPWQTELRVEHDAPALHVLEVPPRFVPKSASERDGFLVDAHGQRITPADVLLYMWVSMEGPDVRGQYVTALPLDAEGAFDVHASGKGTVRFAQGGTIGSRHWLRETPALPTPLTDPIQLVMDDAGIVRVDGAHTAQWPELLRVRIVPAGGRSHATSSPPVKIPPPWQIDNVQPGRQRIEIESSSFWVSQAGRTRDKQGPALATARHVEVFPGKQTIADFGALTFCRARGTCISPEHHSLLGGRAYLVLAAQDAPLRRIEFDEFESHEKRAVIDTSGTFDWPDLAPGHYVVRVATRAGDWLFGRFEMGAAHRDDLQITLRPAVPAAK